VRKASWLAILATLVGALVFGPVGIADANSSLPIVVPQITGASSNAVCASTIPCLLTVTVTYNTAVGVAFNAAPDFTITDNSNGATCSVQSVTTIPPPSPIVPPVPANALYLRSLCSARPGDSMLLTYNTVTPILSAGWVYNLHYPAVRAKSPDSHGWIEGP
jgi:hypothetical protein